MMDHVIHRHRERVLITQHDHAQRIAHKDGVNTCQIDSDRGCVVVGGEHRDWFGFLLMGAERERGDFLAIYCFR